MTHSLRLRAMDGDDLKIVSAHLQDAIVPISEMTYLPAESRFVMVANRFRWEVAADGAPAEGHAGIAAERADGPAYERINCGVCFDGISTVRYRGINLRDRDRILELLAVDPVEAGIIDLHFAGGGCIRLEGEAWRCRIEDIGEAWPTTVRPHHPLDDPDQDKDRTAG